MRHELTRKFFNVAVVFLALLYGACEKSDTVAPDGSTISISATPANILLNGGVQASPVDIIATVRNSIGVPLPGQDVRFTQTSGSLDPQAGTPVSTDSFGNALTILSLATQTTTITAQSGKATATLALQTTTCNVSTIELSLNSFTFLDCSDKFDLIVTVKDSSNDPCVGVIVSFATTTTSTPPSTDVSLIIQPGSKSTDIAGEAKTQVSLAGDCGTKCVGVVASCLSSGQAVVGTAGGQPSAPVTVFDSIP
jgi:hypothetical protein